MKRKHTSHNSLKNQEELQELLRKAVLQGDLQAVELLVEQGANIDGVRGPLHLAAITGKGEILQYIMENGRHNAYSKQIALLDAARKGQLEIVKILTQEYKVKSGHAIHAAIEEGYIGIVRFLIEGDNSYLTACGSISDSLLETAIRSKQKDIVKMLLEEYKVDPRISIHPTSPWGYAVCGMINGSEKSLSIVKLLMLYGVNIDQPIDSRRNINALLDAILSNKVNIVEFLLAHGADANYVDKDSRSGIHALASRYSLKWVNTQDFMEMVMLLVQYGCQVDRIDKKGKTPKDYLAGKGEEAINTLNEAIALGIRITEHNKQLLEQTLKYIINLANLPYLPNEVIGKIIGYAGGLGQRLNTEEVAILKALTAKKMNTVPEERKMEEDTHTQPSYSDEEGNESNSESETTKNSHSDSYSNSKPYSDKQHDELENTQANDKGFDNLQQMNPTDNNYNDNLPGEIIANFVLGWIQELPEWLKEIIMGLSSTQRLFKMIEKVSDIPIDEIYKAFGITLEELIESKLDNKEYDRENQAKINVEKFDWPETQNNIQVPSNHIIGEEYSLIELRPQNLINHRTLPPNKESIFIEGIEDNIVLLNNINTFAEELLLPPEILTNDHLNYWAF